jgi:hypothetical protein
MDGYGLSRTQLPLHDNDYDYSTPLAVMQVRRACAVLDDCEKLHVALLEG